MTKEKNMTEFECLVVQLQIYTTLSNTPNPDLEELHKVGDSLVKLMGNCIRRDNGQKMQSRHNEEYSISQEMFIQAFMMLHYHGLASDDSIQYLIQNAKRRLY